MYERFFKFSCKPFALNPDPEFLYRSRQHAAALTMLEYALESQASFCVLTGEIGSGKTTVTRQLMRMLGQNTTVGMISNTHERFGPVLPWALSALGIVTAQSGEIAMYEALTNFVVRRYGQGGRTLLIVDEAQNLPTSSLEELRLLSNINSEKDVALQILLVGQPELRAKLERPELLQFAQRIAVGFHLQSLDLADTCDYIRHRLRVAGNRQEIFSGEALELIHARTQGVPRLINQICDLALVYAFAEQRQSIDGPLLRQVFQERDRNSGKSLVDAPAFLPMVSKPIVSGTKRI